MDPGTQKVILGILEKSFTKSASVFWPSCFPEVRERANIHLDISDNTRASKRWNMSEELRGSSSGMWSTSLVLISRHSYTAVIPGHSTDLETFTIHKTNLCLISLNLHKVTVWTDFITLALVINILHIKRLRYTLTLFPWQLDQLPPTVQNMEGDSKLATCMNLSVNGCQTLCCTCSRLTTYPGRSLAPPTLWLI